MSQYLVLTAMGPDRMGSVSELTKLASECGCNILDSKMAIFGEEFAFIMMLKGDIASINQLEVKLPAFAMELDLLTMMKRTSAYKPLDYNQQYQAQYSGIDQPGVLKSVTAFFANRNIDLSSLRSEINPQTDIMSATLLFTMQDDSCVNELENDFLQLCEQINVQGCIKKSNY
ncbi:glycine cleavage system protein R [Thalassotalea eurytherma]|uniref:Glycine cleavage system transcriptional repressor n=1 Tax=Thalassotalea eurytherma TaxID=1144278 RepID=A0ABQ6GYL0_9GAMM|nr:ACT domain-containing protein [Thalassotalea eurytherma]GLX81038.1 glycine cleavage system transcriptional regulator [Thalassotalea eurytherma]